ncbi:MAG TPA: S41 family peptidase [Bdellovibrionota bacterium]|nr:S41 family peptidase [Bdellovibrionota bacterium]
MKSKLLIFLVSLTCAFSLNLAAENPTLSLDTTEQILDFIEHHFLNHENKNLKEIREKVTKKNSEPLRIIDDFLKSIDEYADFTFIQNKPSEIQIAHYYMRDEILYLSLPSFNGINIATSISQILKSKKPKGLILDLRNNYGGELLSGINLLNLFIPSGDFFELWTRTGFTRYSSDPDKCEFKDLPIVILINENSQSIAEAVAGVMQQNHRAKLIGKKTFGKGIAQAEFSLQENGIDVDGTLKLTYALCILPGELNFHGVGIYPDVTVENETNKDLQLEKAFETL